MKSAYNLLFKEPDWFDPWWKVLWKMRIPPKLNFVCWLVYQGKILFNEQRVRRHLTFNSTCQRCGWPIEYVLHILRDCVKARYGIFSLREVKLQGFLRLILELGFN